MSKTIVSIIAIAVLLLTALFLGHDSVLLTGGVVVIAGLGGYSAGKIKKPPAE